MQKKNLLILFGGMSSEHEVSVMSARNVAAAVDQTKFDVTLVGISQTGEWVPCTFNQLQSATNVSLLKSGSDGSPSDTTIAQTNRGGFELTEHGQPKRIDVVFPVFHGALGEDGAMQGVLKIAQLPFVGPDVLGSAVCMDKDISKRLLKEAGIPVADALVVRTGQRGQVDFGIANSRLGLPMFVKPANAGSSVGVTKVHSEDEFAQAVDIAFQYDDKILIEEAISGREIESAVLGNENPECSVLGEIIPGEEFYSYEDKYNVDSTSRTVAPADLPDGVAAEVRAIAIQAFKLLACEGMARVDFFVTADNRIYLNEVNTIPGFTSISMYPKLWEASGLSYSDLITKLTDLAIERFERQQRLSHSK